MSEPVDLPWTAALSTPAMNAINSALAVAEDPADFLGRVDVILRRPGSLHTLAEQHGAPEALDTSIRQGGIDVENAVTVHRYLGAMDRANAASGPFWTYAAFVTYRAYMEERWSLAGLKEPGGWRHRVKDRWILASITRGNLIRHGVARLWWVTDLTVDPARRFPLSVGDAYGYTREMFKSEDRIISTLDREVGAIPSLTRAVLERAAAGGKTGEDKPFRNLMRALTLVYGYRDVGMLDESSLSELLTTLAGGLSESLESLESSAVRSG
jgi:hypothetical protein